MEPGCNSATEIGFELIISSIAGRGSIFIARKFISYGRIMLVSLRRWNLRGITITRASMVPCAEAKSHDYVEGKWSANQLCYYDPAAQL